MYQTKKFIWFIVFYPLAHLYFNNFIVIFSFAPFRKYFFLMIIFLYVAVIAKANIALPENQILIEHVNARGWKGNAMKNTSVEVRRNLARIKYIQFHFLIFPLLKFELCAKNAHFEKLVQTFKKLLKFCRNFI